MSRLLDARRAAALACAEYCASMAQKIRTEPPAGMSEPERANVVRAFVDLEKQMREKARRPTPGRPR